jgi:hypothetical protein
MPRADLLNVIERAYDFGATETDWLAGLAQSASAAFSGPTDGALAYTYRIEENRVVTTGMGGEKAFECVPVQSHKELPLSVLKMAYRDTTHCGAMSRALVAQDGPVLAPLHTQLWNDLRLDDAYAIYAPNGSNQGFGLGIGLPRGHFGIHDSRDWSQIDAKFGSVARHIEQSLALRRSLNSGQGVVASFDESGRGEFDSQSTLQKENLLRLALHQERNRDAVAAGNLDGLQRWHQLLDGGWSIIRQQGGGRRLRFLVVRNPTADLAALGLSNKEIAFERNCPESTVANLLTRAMRRMGVANRVHLVLLARSLGVHRASGPK